MTLVIGQKHTSEFGVHGGLSGRRVLSPLLELLLSEAIGTILDQGDIVAIFTGELFSDIV